MSRPEVSIVIATLNNPYTQSCLESVLRNTSVHHEAIVVNNSTVSQIRRCLAGFGKKIRVIQNPRNLGYTKAANQGIQASRGKFICFLNNDTLVPPGWMERLLQAARLPGVGAVSPLAQWERYEKNLFDRKLIHACSELLDAAIQRWHAGKVQPARWLSGFCWMIPRRVFEREGLFDERFFFGWEDIDYCVRLRLKGYRLLKVSSLFVYHKRSASVTPQRHASLVRQSQEVFLSKWNSAFGTRFTFPTKVFSFVDKTTEKVSRRPIFLEST